MPLTETHIPNKTHWATPATTIWLSRSAVEGLGRLEVHNPQPDYDQIAIAVEAIAKFLGEVEVVSDKDRELLGELAMTASGAAQRMEQSLNNVGALPESVPWRQVTYDKMEDLLCRIEDIAETAALLASKEFHELIETQINTLKNDGTGS